MLQHLEGYQGRISRTVMDLSEITSPSHLYQRANDIDRGGRRRHGEVTCVSTLSCFGTDRGHDHLEVDDRPFSSFFSTSRIMRPISRQVPRAHDGHLSLCDASSHSVTMYATPTQSSCKLCRNRGEDRRSWWAGRTLREY